MPEKHPGAIEKATANSQRQSKKNGGDSPGATPDTTPAAAEPTATMEPTRAQRSRHALAEEQAELTEAGALHDHHTAAAAELGAFLASGQASLADLDSHIDQWSRAQAAEVVTAKLVEGCKRNVGRATAALVNDDARIADLIADALPEMLGDHAEVNVVTEARDVQAPTDPRSSVAYVLQDQPSREQSGILSGTVSITYYRAKGMATLDGQEVEHLCRARGYDLDVNATGYSAGLNGQSYDVARVVVRKAFALVPVLNEVPTEDAINGLAQGIAARLADAVRYKGQRVGVRLMGDPVEVGASASVSGVQIDSTEHDGANGERVTVSASFVVTPSKDLTANELAALRDAMERCVGIAESGTGRIVAVENVQTSWVEKRSLPPGTVVEGYGRPLCNVRATLVLAYRVA